jgi:steroid 5-alpha reductase family enzyme
MGAVHVLDNYYLAITFLITVGYQLFFFAIAFSLKFDKLTGEHNLILLLCQKSILIGFADFAGGTNFVVLAIITLALNHQNEARNIVASVFIMIWGARLSGFLLFRIIKTGKDDRFDDKRDNFFKFLGFWVFQMIWVWTVSLPVTLINSPNVAKYGQKKFGTPCDIVGVIMFAIGFLMEAVSDVQKYRFRTANPERKKFMSSGLFAWTRHPNYFGEILLQFGKALPQARSLRCRTEIS